MLNESHIGKVVKFLYPHSTGGTKWRAGVVHSIARTGAIGFKPLYDCRGGVIQREADGSYMLDKDGFEGKYFSPAKMTKLEVVE